MTLTSALKLLVVVAMIAAVSLGAMLLTPIAAPHLRTLALTAAILGLHGIVALGQATARERGKVRRLMMAGLAISACGASIWLWLVWREAIAGERIAGIPVIAATASGWAVLLMVIGMALTQPAPARSARFVRGATVALAIFLMAAWPVAIRLIEADAWEAQFLERAIAILCVLTVAGLITNMVMARMLEPGELADEIADHRSVEVACPRCNRWQTIRLGRSACEHCGLRIRVQVA